MPPGSRPDARPPGPGRLLVLVYGFFAFAATGRAGYQLITKATEAPVAYTLSALAALVYVVGVVLVVLVERTGRHQRTAVAWCVLEIAGVIGVGTASVIAPSSFPDTSVWSEYGAGYGFVPAVLPVLALWWLLTAGSARVEEAQSARRSA